MPPPAARQQPTSANAGAAGTAGTKGQLISKCLFGIFNSPKNEQKQFGLRYSKIKVDFFVCFLGDLKIQKNTFEIN